MNAKVMTFAVVGMAILLSGLIVSVYGLLTREDRIKTFVQKELLKGELIRVREDFKNYAEATFELDWIRRHPSEEYGGSIRFYDSIIVDISTRNEFIVPFTKMKCGGNDNGE